MDKTEFEYDVGLSFAGEQREYVEQVADELKSRGVRVFFDDYEKVQLWGTDLYSHLDEIYQHLCRYCVLFVSREYAGKVSTSARALARGQKSWDAGLSGTKRDKAGQNPGVCCGFGEAPRPDGDQDFCPAVFPHSAILEGGWGRF